MTTVPDPAQNSNIPQKQCLGPCGRILPATTEFFHRHAQNGLQPRCKECRSTKKPCIDDGYKVCSGCKRRLLATTEFFHSNKGGKYGLKSKCKQCQSEVHKVYRKTHPEVEKAYLEAHREEKRQYAIEYYATHKEIKNQYNRQYNIDHQAELKAYRARRYRENIDKYRKQNKQNYKKNAERNRQYAARYRQEHPEQIRAYQEAHREERRRYDAMYHAMHREKKNAYHRKYNRDHCDQLREYNLWYRQTERARIAARVNAHKRRAYKRNSQGTHTAKDLYDQLRRQKNRCYYCGCKLGKARNNWHADHIVPLSKGGSDSIDNIVIACPPCNQDKRAKMLHEWKSGGRLL